MNWQELHQRIVDRCPERIGEVEGALRDALHGADWLRGMASELDIEFERLPAAEVPDRYQAQLELLVDRWNQHGNRLTWGSIQRILYECYDLSCDEICRIESWRRTTT